MRVATLPGVGVAGLKLRYPTGDLQHGGVGVGIHLYGLMWRHAREGGWGVFGSPDHPRNWLAIMGACQMVRREVFDSVGGFDEAYRIANSDVALSLRAHRAGWRTAYTPYAELTHHEGASRGRTNPLEDMVRSAADLRRLGFDDDPYFHPGLSATDPIPRLRAPGEPDTRENLARDIERYLAAGPKPEAPLDLFDDWDVQCAAGLPRDQILWPPQPASAVTDRWSAARFVIDLVRARPDLRARFPRALSAGPDSGLATWLEGEGGDRLGLPAASRALVRALFADDPAARARQLYLWRDDLRAKFPLALLPPERRSLAAWMLRHGHGDEGIRLEEAWWLLLACAEDPAGELVRTYLLTPAWQEAHPCGLTVFGRDAFAAWVAQRYNLPPDTRAGSTPLHGPSGLPRPSSCAWPMPRATSGAPCIPPRSTPSGTCTPCWPGSPARMPGCRPRSEPGAPSARRTAPPPRWPRPAPTSSPRSAIPLGCASPRRRCRTRWKWRAPSCPAATCGPTGATTRTMPRSRASRSTTRPSSTPSPSRSSTPPISRSDLAERTPRTYRVAYWYWELDSVPEWWVEKARTVDEVWAATAFVADALRKVLPVPVRTMFPGVRVGAFTRRPREAFGLPGGERFTFLFSFHMSSIMERKNPLALVRAFRQAFRPEEPVDLVLKTTAFNDEVHGVQVKQLRAAGEGANVVVLDRVMALEETLSLMDACDCYVSLHHSEGLGLTMAEAMLLGKPCIATRYSGNLDFMDDDNSLLVDCEIVPLGRRIPPYDASAYWAEPSVDHAAALMRRVYENQAWAAELGAKGQADARTRLSLEAAGQAHGGAPGGDQGGAERTAGCLTPWARSGQRGMLASMVCRYEHFLTDWYGTWASVLPLGRYGIEPGPRPGRPHRKAWEWSAIAQALHERGMLEPGRKGCGFAVGVEPLTSLFAARGAEILATDLARDGRCRTLGDNRAARGFPGLTLPVRADRAR